MVGEVEGAVGVHYAREGPEREQEGDADGGYREQSGEVGLVIEKRANDQGADDKRGERQKQNQPHRKF